MDKIDLKKSQLKALYGPSAKEPALVDVPPLRYLMVDGKGDPNTSQDYVQAVEALYSVSYTAKFKVKKAANGVDYAVMPLEGLWWADDPSVFVAGDKSKWHWTMMILQPAFATDAVIRTSIEEVREKKALPAIGKVRLEEFAEGPCAQILHVGPFSEEGPTIQRLHHFIEQQRRAGGQASRDLPERHPARGPEEVEDDHPAADDSPALGT